MVVMNFELRRNVFFLWGLIYENYYVGLFIYFLFFFEFGKRAIYLGEEFEIESMVQQSVFWYMNSGL